jgi:hypothetical protein
MNPSMTMMDGFVEEKYDPMSFDTQIVDGNWCGKVTQWMKMKLLGKKQKHQGLVNFLRFIHCPTFLISSIAKAFPICIFIHFQTFPQPFKGILHKLTIEGTWPIKKMNEWWNHFHHIQSTIIPFKGSILKQCTISLLKQYTIRILSVL